MRASFLKLAASGAVALMCGSGFALAGALSSSVGGLQDLAKTDELILQLARGGGRGGGGGGRGGGHHGGGHGFSHHGGGAHFVHRGRGRGFVGGGYYGYYNDCWYSRRYGRWICPYY